MSRVVPILILGGLVGLYFMSGSAVQNAVVETVKTATGDKTPPRGIRNNNPLNIKYNPANKWLGQVGSDGTFCIFDTAVNGIRAGAILLRKYMSTYGLNTLAAITSKWSPDVNGLSGAYASSVSKFIGVATGAVLNASADTLALIIRGMIAVENGAKYLNYYSDATIKTGVNS